VVAVAGFAFSSHVLARAELVVPKPAGLGFEEAAALPIAFLTARNSPEDVKLGLAAGGNDFIVTVQDETVDTWTDARLKKGGVGFFCGRGEKARLRWVSVSHQYDTLGRLCAFLVPYGLGGLNGP
jgi:hypothetical protein